MGGGGSVPSSGNGNTKESEESHSESNDRIANLERQLREAQNQNQKLLNKINKIKEKSKRNEKGKEEAHKDANGKSARGPPSSTHSASKVGSSQSKHEPLTAKKTSSWRRLYSTAKRLEAINKKQLRAERIAADWLKSFRRRRTRSLHISRVDTNELLDKLDPDKHAMQMRVNDIFKLFQDGGMDLEVHCWCEEPKLFLMCAELLLMKGEPVMADFVLFRAQKDMARESNGKVPVSLMKKINLLHAKALCGMNSFNRAIDILEELYTRHCIRTEEVLGLYGRCHKDLAAGEWFGLDLAVNVDVDAARKAHFQKALKYYIESFELSERRSSYTGINAASMALLAGKWDMAVSLAKEVRQLCESEVCTDPVSIYWNYATRGECAVIQRDWKAALNHYTTGIYGLDLGTEKARRAYCEKHIALSWLLGTRRQCRLLMRYISTDASDGNLYSETEAKAIDSLFQIPNVMCLLCKQAADLLPNTSHLNATQLQTFVAELHRRIEENHVGFAYCSGFPGADIIFAEAVLNSGNRVELYVMLPIPAEAFRELVVQGLDGKKWGERLDKVLEGASRVVVANDMSKDITDVNLQYNYRTMTGMAVAKADVTGTALHLCYCSPAADGLTYPKREETPGTDIEVQPFQSEDDLAQTEGATAEVATPEVDATLEEDIARPSKKSHSLEDEISAFIAKHGRSWFSDPQVIYGNKTTRESGKSSRWQTIPIPLDTRGPTPKRKTMSPSSKAKTQRLRAFGSSFVQSVRPSSCRGPPQVIKAVLFADVKGFSKLSEHEVYFFTKHVFGAAADLIQHIPEPDRPILRNTWGDAFYFVFNEVAACAHFSLRLRDLFNCTNWEDHNLPNDLAIRISCHAAPVFHMTNSVLEKESFTGVHTSRGARIEPITPPGSVYCSRAFAAMSDADSIDGGPPLYACPFIGNVPLAKSYGMLPVHVIRWTKKPETELPYRPEPEPKRCWQPVFKVDS